MIFLTMNTQSNNHLVQQNRKGLKNTTRRFIITLIFFLIVTTILAFYYFAILGDSDDAHILPGSTTGNIVNGGLIAYHEEFVYYTGENGHIYKSKLDGSRQEKLNDTYSIYINVVDDWVYYSNHDDEGRIYKMRTDGSSVTRLNNERSRDLHVTGDWVYYINSSMEPYESYYDTKADICKIKTDGSNHSLILGGGIATSLALADNILYFGSYKGIYRMGIEGADKIKLTDLEAYQIVVHEEWVYFVTDIIGAGSYVGGDILARIKTDGSSFEKLYSMENEYHQWFSDFNVSGNRLYYIMKEEARPYSLNVLDIESGDTKTLVYADGSWISSISLVEDFVYYKFYEHKNGNYTFYLQRVDAN
jgi:hypothetical protein